MKSLNLLVWDRSRRLLNFLLIYGGFELTIEHLLFGWLDVCFCFKALFDSCFCFVYRTHFLDLLLILTTLLLLFHTSHWVVLAGWCLNFLKIEVIVNLIKNRIAWHSHQSCIWFLNGMFGQLFLMFSWRIQWWPHTYSEALPRTLLFRQCLLLISFY